LVARLAVLLSRGVRPQRICVANFKSRRGHRSRGSRRAPARGIGPDGHVDRLPLLRAARRRVQTAAPSAGSPEPSQLDTYLSAWKIEGRPPPEGARPVLEAYADLLRIRGAVDFDDLVVRACDLLETDARLRLRWQSRFLHVCVDEFQDVDAAQLRLVRILAAPEDNLFVVGDDDQP
jgi:superfamily I DNA/RNA helicase